MPAGVLSAGYESVASSRLQLDVAVRVSVYEQACISLPAISYCQPDRCVHTNINETVWQREWTCIV